MIAPGLTAGHLQQDAFLLDSGDGPPHRCCCGQCVGGVRMKWARVLPAATGTGSERGLETRSAGRLAVRIHDVSAAPSARAGASGTG